MMPEMPPLPQVLVVAGPILDQRGQTLTSRCPDCEHHLVSRWPVMPDLALPHVCVVDGQQVRRRGTRAVVML